jgi:hypothetical protein
MRSSAGRHARPLDQAILATMSEVILTVVHDEMEADVICGLLRARSIACFHRKTNVAGAWSIGFASGGPIEILVDEQNLNAARELLSSSR